MPEPITLLIIAKLLGLTALFIWSWAYIRDFFSTVLIPFLRTRVSSTLATGLEILITWIDQGVAPIRSEARKTLESLQQVVRAIISKYTRVNATTVKSETEAIIDMGGGKFIKQIVEQELSIDDLPAEVRAKILKNPRIQVDHDVLKTFIDGTTEKLKLQE